MGTLSVFFQQAVVLLSFAILIISKHTKAGAVFLEEFSHDDSATFGVQLYQQDDKVVMSNGIVNVTLAVPAGFITDITYKGSDNLLEAQKVNADDRGHWDITWSRPRNDNPGVDKLVGTSYKIIKQDKYQTEISFTRTWTSFNSKESPLNIDKRYVMLAGSPGFYTYTVMERLKGWPAFDVHEGRIVFKLRQNKFEYMAVSDERQRFMPTDKDHSRGQTLDYKEAVLLTNPTNPQFKGEVDDKYLYSSDNKDSMVHGWVSNDGVGFWIITPSNEFRIGGPLKQDLTSHVGPVALSMLISLHYAGYDQALKFDKEEYWKKVFGPVFVYLNSAAAAKPNPSILWNDAKQRMKKEVGDWPYNFPLSKDFIQPNQRGSISGQFLVHDSMNKHAVPGALAYVGLAPPGAAGSWQLESKGYQFWAQADENGDFMIKNVIAGTYSLFAWHRGTLGDYKHNSDITITPGSSLKINNKMIFEAPRKGATLWEIGVPDRTAAEFFIPDPPKHLKIHQYPRPIQKFRQYGLWTRYQDLYPKRDLVFTVGVSDYKKHWFFAHVTRNLGNNQYPSTTWTIEFDLKEVHKRARYTLQLALASANEAELQVRFNDPKKRAPDFSTGLIGKDNALARHGIHGTYRFYSIDIEGSLLVVGRNNIFLRQSRNGKFTNVMYDYIRLEGPHAPKAKI